MGGHAVGDRGTSPGMEGNGNSYGGFGAMASGAGGADEMGDSNEGKLSVGIDFG